MQRIAYQLRIKSGMGKAYDDAHREVWPELIQELTSFGVSNYSIFRRGQSLFLYLHVPDFNELVRMLAQSEVNQRWQRTMAPLFEPVPDLSSGESLAIMDEVFFMPGASQEPSKP